MDQTDNNKLHQEINELKNKLAEAYEERDLALKRLKENEEIAKKAENASKMKSLFLANMSHEIRTPLNAIEGFSRIMAETDSRKERMNFYEIIETSNNHLQSLINEILDLSRVESGEIRIKRTLIDVDEMGKGIKNIFKFRCPDQVALEWKGLQGMQILMNTDQNRLTQVFSNLISNALKHTNKGSIVFGFNLAEGNDTIEFYVEDTGTGIAPEDIDTIFHTYVSRDAETNSNSFGLGLPLCKIIVEKLGGELQVDSELDKGTKFTFKLPFEGTISEKLSPNSISSPTRSVVVTTRSKGANADRKRILVAEDEDINFELVKRILQGRYEVMRAKDGIEAVTLNEDEKPDLILMDIRMPNMNGLDATRIIKEVNSHVPVIALSAFAFQDYIDEAKNAGCDEFLAKPFKINKLNAVIEKYIGQ